MSPGAARSIVAFNSSAVVGLLFGAVGSWLYDKMTEPTAQLRRADTLRAEIVTLLLLVLIPTFTALFNLAIGHRIHANTRVSLFLSGVLLIAAAVPLLMIVSFTNSCNIDRSFPIPGYRC